MACPIVIATNGIGIPVTEVPDGPRGGVPYEIATNGFGTPVVFVASGGMPVTLSGDLTPLWVPRGDNNVPADMYIDAKGARAWYDGVAYYTVADFKTASGFAGTIVQNADGWQITDGTNCVTMTKAGVPFPRWNASEGTFIAKTKLSAFAASKTLFTFGDGTANNRGQLFFNTSATLRADIRSGNVAQPSLPATPTLAAGIHSFALTYDVNLRRDVSVDGQLFIDVATTPPANVSTLFIGAANAAGGTPLNDTIVELTYFAKRLSERRLEQLTTDPDEVFTLVAAGPITIPSNYFMVHTRDPASITLLGSNGAKMHRLRDCNVQWSQLVPRGLSGVAFTAGTTDTVNWTAHGLTTAYGVYFSNTGGALPSGITAYQVYYPVNITANTFQLSLTPGGAPIALGTAGTGTSIANGILLERINPAAGTGGFDLLVNAASAAGMGIVYDCTNVPTWVSATGVAGNRPANQFLVEQFLRFIKFHYGDKVTFWETWNEPNGGSFVGTMTGANNDLYLYASYLKDSITAMGLSAVWKVLSPCWNITSGAALMGSWLGANGGAAKVDIVSYHWYQGNGYLTYDYAAADAYHTQAAANAPGKEIWSSEVGDSQPRIEELYRANLYIAAKGSKVSGWYCYDTFPGPGGQDMRITSYPGLPQEYFAMMTQLAGASITNVGKSRSGRVKATVNGVDRTY